VEKEWVMVFESHDEMQVESARQELERNEIDAVIINKQDRAYKFGQIELYVHRDNVLHAKQILKDF
jgi:hypothetical protein